MTMSNLRSTLTILILSVSTLHAQHTFSIVAVDTLTGEIGSAGATCGDTIIWPGTPGAYIISDVLPGIGAIHTQSFWDRTNQVNAHNRMIAGDSPDEIITWLKENDVNGTPSQRQYGIVDFRDGNSRSAAYTGKDCSDYKNHILGSNYAIQGNILLGQHILDSMESRFLEAEGTLADKLMAALQGANVVGADSRCSDEGVSSLSAFLRIARSTDRADSLMLDMNIGATPVGADPIDALERAYNNWRAVGSVDESKEWLDNVKVYLSPTNEVVFIEFPRDVLLPDEIAIVNLLGQVVIAKRLNEGVRRVELALNGLPDGIYWPVLSSDGVTVASFKAFVVE